MSKMFILEECKQAADFFLEKLVGEGVGFERIRRVTGYLSGDVSRFNNGKRAEEKDRVKHTGIKDIKCTASKK